MIFNTPRSAEPPILTIDKFAGINQSAVDTQINTNESPDMLNMRINEFYKLEKRHGYEKLFEPISEGKINGMWHGKLNDTTFFLFAHCTKLYNIGEEGPEEICCGLADNRVRFFVYGSSLYILDGTNYKAFDGVSVVDVEDIAYIPTLTLGRAPTGGGTPYEQLNLLQPKFKDSFSVTEPATEFQLSLNGLDDTEVTAVVNGEIKAETDDFTVDRETGIVTFNDPVEAGTNHVVITAAKTIDGFADRIKKCTLYMLYGGDNDTRIFLAGNPDYKNYRFHSGLDDPTYWPEDQYVKIGRDDEAITGFVLQYDSQVIYKERSIYYSRYELSDYGAIFPVRPINDTIGCVASDSIQLIENNPVAIAPSGVHALTASNVRDERNVQMISGNVNRSLLEKDITKAVSVDFKDEYWLAIGDDVWVYNYRAKAWYPFNNIPASCFLVKDNELYFGSEGTIYKFNDGYSDDGKAIEAYWKSKLISFNADEYLKMVDKVFFTLQPYRKTSATLYYVTDKVASEAVKVSRMDLFSYNEWDYGYFTYRLSAAPQSVMAKIKAKKIVYFQVMLENKLEYEAMGILSVGIKYIYQRMVK